MKTYKKAEFQCAKDGRMVRGPAYLHLAKVYCLDHYGEFFKNFNKEKYATKSN